MSERRLRPLAAIVAAALFAVAFALVLVPWLTRERTISSSTPTSMPLFDVSDVRLRPGSTVCVADFGLDDTAEGLRLAVSNPAASPAPQPLRVEVRAPGGYRARGTLAPRYAFGAPVVVALRAPAGDIDGARACVRNVGRRTVGLAGTTRRGELSRVTVRLDGKRIDTQPWLTFVQRPEASVLAHGGEILERVSTFRPFPAAPPLLGLLALLVLVGVPLAIVAALAVAERADRRGS